MSKKQKPYQGTRGWCAFDIETANLIQDVGGASKIHLLTFSYAVTFSEFDGYRLYVQGEEEDLLKYLDLFDRVITYNGEHFDFRVMKKHEKNITGRLMKKSWDLMRLIQKASGKMTSLDSVGAAFKKQEKKTGNGVLAVEWWKSKEFKKRMDGFKYCKGDVRILVKAVKKVIKTGKIAFIDKKSGEKKEVEITWS